MNEVIKQIKIIAVYGRVSTSKQEEDGTIKTQLSSVREFAKKNGYTIVQEYTDDGWSGDILARPQLDQLRQDAKKKIWEAVLMYDPDRLARRYSFQQLVMDELREGGIEVLFVTTPSPKTGEEKVMHGMKGIFSEWERLKITERFRIGKIRKVKEGHILTTEAPYGLNYVRKKDKVHGYYVINEEEIVVLKMIFSWVANDKLTLRAVVRKLQELGISPRKSKRGVWNTSTLASILRNKTYIGEAHYGSSYAVVPQNPLNTEKYRKIRKTSRKIKPEEDWIKIPVPAVIDIDLFNRAQAQLKINFELCKRNRKNQYLLAGKIWCDCTSRRTGEGPQRGKHLYYRCSNRINNFPLPPTCLEKGINARIADKLVWQKLIRIMSSGELLIKHMNHWLSARNNKPVGSVVVVENLKKEVLKLKEREDRYNKAYGADLFSIEKLREYTTPIRERLASLESQISMACSEEDQMEDVLLPSQEEVNVFTTGETPETLKNLNFEGKRVIVMGIIEKVIGTQKELIVSGRIPIQNINHVKYKTNDRYRGAP